MSIAKEPITFRIEVSDKTWRYRTVDYLDEHGKYLGTYPIKLTLWGEIQRLFYLAVTPKPDYED